MSFTCCQRQDETKYLHTCGCPSAAISAVDRSLVFSFCGHKGFEEQLADGEAEGEGSYNYYLRKEIRTNKVTPANSSPAHPNFTCRTGKSEGTFFCSGTTTCTVTARHFTTTRTKKIEYFGGSNEVFCPTSEDGVTVCNTVDDPYVDPPDSGGDFSSDYECGGPPNCTIFNPNGQLPEGGSSQPIDPGTPPNEPATPVSDTVSIEKTYIGFAGSTSYTVYYWSKSSTIFDFCSDDSEDWSESTTFSSSSYTWPQRDAYYTTTTTTITLSDQDTQLNARSRTATDEETAPFETGAPFAEKPAPKSKTWTEIEAKYAVVAKSLVKGVAYKVWIKLETSQLDSEDPAVETDQSETFTASKKFEIIGGTLNSSISDEEFIEANYSITPSSYHLPAGETVIVDHANALTAAEGTTVKITQVSVEKNV